MTYALILLLFGLGPIALFWIAAPRLFNLPIEELAFFVIDGLLVGTLALLLEERFRDRG